MKILSLLIIFLLNLALSAQNDVSSLVATMLPNTLEEDLQELCDDISGRVTGSQANADAIEWAYDKFTKTGVMGKRTNLKCLYSG